VKLFVRELLDMAVVRELPADAVVEAVTHPDGDFVFGNPPRQLQRIRYPRLHLPAVLCPRLLRRDSPAYASWPVRT
jgi:hypothetical protein